MLDGFNEDQEAVFEGEKAWVDPPGLGFVLTPFPPLKRWAILARPSGARWLAGWRSVQWKVRRFTRAIVGVTLFGTATNLCMQAQQISLQELVTPSTVIVKDGKP